MSSSHETMDVRQEGRRVFVTLDRPKALNAQNEGFLRAFQAVRRVCSGSVIVLDQVSLPLSLLPRPLARVAARPGYQEWFMFNRRGFERALDAAGFEVEGSSGFLRDRPGPGVNRSGFPWSMRIRHATGLAGVSLALRGRAR